jgi:hypothetical protein
MKNQCPIKVSFVAVSRNDNHGGTLTDRMQSFVHLLSEQCNKHELRSELILVEWNPPPENMSLKEELIWPIENEYLSIKIITVPPEVHCQLKNSDKFPLFQMIGKNVGIIRAQGEFILATNIDIIFSDPLMLALKNQLDAKFVYRADRLDVPNNIHKDKGSAKKTLSRCKEQYFRMHARNYSLVMPKSGWPSYHRIFFRLSNNFPMALYFLHILYRKNNRPENPKAKRLIEKLLNKIKQIKPKRLIDKLLTKIKQVRERKLHYLKLLLSLPFIYLKYYLERIRVIFLKYYSFFILKKDTPFTNACGDFTLMHKDSWLLNRGYPEWQIFGWHLDSVLLNQAIANGSVQYYLGPDSPIFHIEHSPGSGYTPEHSGILFNRLKDNQVEYINDQALEEILVDQENCVKKGGKVVYNDDDWGFSNLIFKTTVISQSKST